MDRFSMYLINEDKSHLGHRINDILTSMQDLQDDMDNLGTRHFNRLVDELVNELRKVIHSQWSTQNHKHLEGIQKVAVALKKTLEDKGNMKEIFPAALQTLQSVAGKLGVKVNDMQAPEMEGEDVTQDNFELTGIGPQEQGPQQDPNMQQDPNQMPPMPDPNQMPPMPDPNQPPM